jgi:hypothetical protein
MKFTLPVQHDPWMANGLETLHRLLHDVEGCQSQLYDDRIEIDISDMETFQRNFGDRIRAKQDLVIFYTKEDEKGQKRYIAKDYLLIQYGKAKERNVLKEKIFLEPEERLRSIFSDLEPGKNTCILCGRTFSKKIDNLKQAVYPFVTKIRSLTGIRDMREYYNSICPLCYLVGTMEWLDEGIIYRCFLGPRARTYSVIFLPVEQNLEKINRAKEHYIQNLNGSHRISNVTIRVSSKQGERDIPTEGENTTALKFFEQFIEAILGELKEKKVDFHDLLPPIERTFCKRWSALVIPSGKVKNIKYKSLILEDEILELLVKLQRDGIRVYENIIRKLSVIEKGQRTLFDETNALREDTATFVLGDDFRKFSRTFLPRKKKVVYFGRGNDLDRLIVYWRLSKMNLENELENLKGAGRTIAKLIKSRPSVLYSMDKAKNRPEFLRALEQASKKLIGLREKDRGEVYPLPLEKVTDLILKSDENQWKEIRDSLLIYASVSYSVDEYRRSKKEKGEKE